MKSRAKVGALAAVVLMAPALGFLAASPAGAAAAAPAVTAVTPASGPSVTSSTASTTTPGGTAVTITGSNFTGATAVHFGSAAATGVTVVSATTITATSPTIANSIGNTVDVTVTTPGGTSATSVNDEYTYPYNYTSAGAVHEASISLSASSPSALVNGSVTLTATAPTDVGPSLDFGLSIVDVTNAAAPVAVAHVPSGTTVSASVSEAAAQTRRYVAAFDACTVYPASCPPGALETPIANDGGVSAPVTVTWSTPVTPPATGGYRLVASDGGIFSFNAPYYGSTGAMHAERPDRGDGGRPDHRRLLAGGLRWRDLQLQRPVLRLDRSHAPERPHRRDGRRSEDGRLLAGGLRWRASSASTPPSRGRLGPCISTSPSWGWRPTRPPGVLAGGLRRRASSASTPPSRGRRGHDPQQAHRGDGGRPDHRGYWLVASDGGHLQLQRPLPGVDGRHDPQQAHRGDGGRPDHRRVLAGGLRRRASSASTPPSRVPRAP